MWEGSSKGIAWSATNGSNPCTDHTALPNQPQGAVGPLHLTRTPLPLLCAQKHHQATIDTLSHCWPPALPYGEQYKLTFACSTIYHKCYFVPYLWDFQNFQKYPSPNLTCWTGRKVLVILRKLVWSIYWRTHFMQMDFIWLVWLHFRRGLQSRVCLKLCCCLYCESSRSVDFQQRTQQEWFIQIFLNFSYFILLFIILLTFVCVCKCVRVVLGCKESLHPSAVAVNWSRSHLAYLS